MPVLITNSQKITLHLLALDVAGNPTRVDGVPQWTTSDQALGTLTPSADGLSAAFVAAGPLGITQIAATADADLTAGTRFIGATLDLQIEVGEAVTLIIQPGAPEPK